MAFLLVTDDPTAYVPLIDVLTEVTVLLWTKISGFIKEKLPGRVPEGKKRASDDESRAVAREAITMTLQLMDKGARAEAESWHMDALCAVMPRDISLWKKTEQNSAKRVINTSQAWSAVSDTPTTPKTSATKLRPTTKNLVANREVSLFAPMKRSYSQSLDANMAINNRPRLDIIHRNIEVWLGLQPDSAESITISVALVIPDFLERTTNASILTLLCFGFRKSCQLQAQNGGRSRQ